MKYNVTITRTGGIVVEAKSIEGAISKVAEMLGKSKPAIYKMCQRGQLPHHKLNGSLFFSQRELENYFLNGKKNT